MNPAQLAETLKTVPDQHLMQAVQGQIPSTPGYLALAEMKRRESMRGGAQMGKAPMTTVVQDQQQMGIGGLKPQGFAAGGIVEEPPLFDLIRRAGEGIASGNRALEAWLSKHGMPRYFRGRPSQEELMRPYVPREPQGPMRAHPFSPEVPPETAPSARMIPAQADVRKTEPVMPATPGGSTRIGVKQSGTGITSVKPAIPTEMPKLPNVEDVLSKDPNELLSKVPTSKILEQIARDAQLKPEQYKQRRGEAREQALARMGAAIASRPGGLGAAFGPALTTGLDYRDAQEKEIRADEKDAEKSLRAVQMAQAQEEINRFGIARDMSTQDYKERADNVTRRYGVAKDKVEQDFKERQLQQAAALAREQMATMLKQANIYASRPAGGAAASQLERNYNTAVDNAKQRMDAYLQKNFSIKLKTPEEFQKLFQQFLDVELSRMGLKPPGTPVNIPQPAGASGAPRFVDNPPGGIVR